MADEKQNWWQSTKEYYDSIKAEMRKVSWPNRRQVESTTAVVIVSVFAFAAYFELVDTAFTAGIKGILNYFSK